MAAVTPDLLQAILNRTCAKMAVASEFLQVADYLPEPARIDPGPFGPSVALPSGEVLASGDAVWSPGLNAQGISRLGISRLGIFRLGTGAVERLARASRCPVFG